MKKTTQIRIAKATSLKPAPRKEVVDIVMKVFKSQPLKIRKHTKAISILKSRTNGNRVFSGRFYLKKGLVKINDHDGVPIETYESTTHHEFAHLRFHWLSKYHKEELEKFCLVVNGLPSPTRYIRGMETKWRTRHFSPKYEEDGEDYHTFNEYANEFHSALAEMKLGVRADQKDHLHRNLLTERQTETAINAYDELWDACS